MQPVSDQDMGDRKLYELTREESLLVSRHAAVSSALGFIVQDMGNAVTTCQEDIKHLEQRLEYENKRLEAYENNLNKVKEQVEEAVTRLSAALNQCASRLGIDAENLASYDVKVNEEGDVTHLIEPLSEEGETQES